MSELAQGRGLDLPDPFAGKSKDPAYLLEGKSAALGHVKSAAPSGEGPGRRVRPGFAPEVVAAGQSGAWPRAVKALCARLWGH